MVKTMGYILTWTTYGTWLQGDTRGWVKDRNTYQVNRSIEKVNKDKMKHPVVRLTKREQNIVRETILGKARERRQKIYAIGVRSNHVHLVLDYDACPISQVVQVYKNAATVALKKNGFCGRLWTRGYDKRYCFDEKTLQNRIDYVRRHRK